MGKYEFTEYADDIDEILAKTDDLRIKDELESLKNKYNCLL